MNTLKINIHNIKSIKDADLELPFENGIYALVGANGCGKSTIMLCLAQLVKKQLNSLSCRDYSNDSFVNFSLGGLTCKWIFTKTNRCIPKGDYLKYNGFYEGSLFYGTRFQDSTIIDERIDSHKIREEDITSADEYVKTQLSYILQGDTEHYGTLMRIKNKNVAEKLKVTNRPYFIKVNGNLISQYSMSSGECLLISLLHFLYNSIVRKSLPSNQKALVLIDEVELALHPIAITRLMELLTKLTKEHDNLIIYLSTHSPEIIRMIHPLNMYKINDNKGVITIENNNYPSYLIRDLYGIIPPDFLLLVEDKLAQQVIYSILSTESMRVSKLIHCVPVGGWQNVLALHEELTKNKVLGVNTKIISILDGDVKDLAKDKYINYTKLFLPFPSIEKLLYDTIILNKNPKLKKLVKDKYFTVESLDAIVAQYHKQVSEGVLKDDNKNFYKTLIKSLDSINISEDTFINSLCKDIMEQIEMSSFVTNLKEYLENKKSK